MNFEELRSAVRYIQKKCKCVDCNKPYRQKDMFFLAATKSEALFELKCPKCKLSTIVTIVNSLKKPKVENINPNAVSKDDILDIKNFLTSFDGNFKKIFN